MQEIQAAAALKVALEEKTGFTAVQSAAGPGVFRIQIPQGGLEVYLYGPERKRLAVSRSAVKVIHIDLDQWYNKAALILNRIAVLCGKQRRIAGRQTVAARIDKAAALEFQQEHHLNGALPGKFRYGLFHQGELVAVAVFSGLRNMQHTPDYRSIELLHFCQKGTAQVQGGLSKLLQRMRGELNPSDVMTYIDRDWSDGEGFLALGFKKVGLRQPVCFCVHRQSFQRSRCSGEGAACPPERYAIFNSGSLKLLMVFDEE